MVIAQKWHDYYFGFQLNSPLLDLICKEYWDITVHIQPNPDEIFDCQKEWIYFDIMEGMRPGTKIILTDNDPTNGRKILVLLFFKGQIKILKVDLFVKNNRKPRPNTSSHIVCMPKILAQKRV